MNITEFIPYARQCISEEDIEAVASSLRGSIITRGPLVEEFEQKIASYCEAKYAVAFSSGTAALMGTFYAAETSPYDLLIATPNTFVSTVSPGIQRGAKPIFVDIDRNTGNFDINIVSEELKKKQSRGHKIVLPVHFSGIAVDMFQLDKNVHSVDVITIEDAAHSLGSRYPSGEKVGSCAWSHMTIFSFHPAKTITTGEGGMVTTNEEELYRRLRLFRNNAMEKDISRWQGDPAKFYEGYYEVVDIAGNYNMTEFQAALGLSQLKRLDDLIVKRRELVTLYRKLLEGVPNIRMFTSAFDSHTAFHLFVLQIDFAALDKTRSQVIQQLKERGIGTQVHYIPLYHHPFLETIYGNVEEDFPQMEKYYDQTLTLPLYPDLKPHDIERIVSALKEVLF